MAQPAIVPIVEGHGDAFAVPVLVRRVLAAAERFDVVVARAVRVPRARLVKRGELSRSIELASADRAGAAAILVVFDADDDCPAELSPELLAREARSTKLPVGIVMAKREFEAWLLGGLDSLRSKRGIAEEASAHEAPEEVRDAKRALTRSMSGSRRYLPVTDQPALAKLVDLDVALARCPSLAKLRREVLRLAQLAAEGAT